MRRRTRCTDCTFLLPVFLLAGETAPPSPSQMPAASSSQDSGSGSVLLPLQGRCPGGRVETVILSAPLRSHARLSPSAPRTSGLSGSGQTPSSCMRRKLPALTLSFSICRWGRGPASSSGWKGYTEFLQAALKETARPPARTEMTGFALPGDFPTRNAEQAGAARGEAPARLGPATAGPSPPRLTAVANAQMNKDGTAFPSQKILFYSTGKAESGPSESAGQQRLSPGPGPGSAAGGGSSHLQGFCSQGARPRPPERLARPEHSLAEDLDLQTGPGETASHTAQRRDRRSPRPLCSPPSCRGSFTLISRPKACDATAPASSAAPRHCCSRVHGPGPEPPALSLAGSGRLPLPPCPLPRWAGPFSLRHLALCRLHSQGHLGPLCVWSFKTSHTVDRRHSRAPAVAPGPSAKW